MAYAGTRLLACAVVVTGVLAGCQPDHHPFVGLTRTEQGTIGIVVSRCDYGELREASLSTLKRDGQIDHELWKLSGPTKERLVDTGVVIADLSVDTKLYAHGFTRYPDHSSAKPDELLVGMVKQNGKLKSLNHVNARPQGC